MNNITSYAEPTTEKLVTKCREEQEERKRQILVAQQKTTMQAKIQAHKEAIRSIVLQSNEAIDPIDLIVIDTETTGLSPACDEILQVSIIDGTGNVLYDNYIKPVAEMWDEAERVNGITYDMVANAPSAESEMPKIAAFIKAARVIVGYNTKFDLDFLREYGCQFNSAAIIRDVMSDFAPIYGEWSDSYGSYKYKSLSVCADCYGYDWGDEAAHNSLADCRATLYCYNQMMNRKEV